MGEDDAIMKPTMTERKEGKTSPEE
jgi:hypothetical protein